MDLGCYRMAGAVRVVNIAEGATAVAVQPLSWSFAR